MKGREGVSRVRWGRESQGSQRKRTYSLKKTVTGDFGMIESNDGGKSKVMSRNVVGN